MSQWYYARDGQALGPIPLERLQQLIRVGELRPTDMVLEQGTTQWVPASSVLGTAAGPPPMPPGYHGGPHEMEPVFEEPGPGFGEHLANFFHRCFTWNLGAVVPSDAERSQLQAHGIEEKTAQQYLVWRRSLLFLVVGVTGLSALLGTIGRLIGLASVGSQGASMTLTGFGMILETVEIVALFALPLMALLAAVLWQRPRASHRLLVVGWAVTFLLPLVLALLPIRWRIHIELGAMAPEQEQMVMGFINTLVAITMLFMQLPVVLSLVSGTIAGCVRVKALLPRALVAGWFLVAASCFQALLLLVLFVVLNYLSGNVVLILAALLGLLAPLVAIAGASLYTRPLSSEEVSGIGVNRIIYASVAVPAAVLFVVALFTARVFGAPIVGFSEPYVMSVWKLLELAISYFGRSMFMTVLAVDLFVRINLSVWRESAKPGAAAGAAPHEETMSRWQQTLDEA